MCHTLYFVSLSPYEKVRESVENIFCRKRDLAPGFMEMEQIVAAAPLAMTERVQEGQPVLTAACLRKYGKCHCRDSEAAVD